MNIDSNPEILKFEEDKFDLENDMDEDIGDL